MLPTEYFNYTVSGPSILLSHREKMDATGWYLDTYDDRPESEDVIRYNIEAAHSLAVPWLRIGASRYRVVEDKVILADDSDVYLDRGRSARLIPDNGIPGSRRYQPVIHDVRHKWPHILGFVMRNGVIGMGVIISSILGFMGMPFLAKAMLLSSIFLGGLAGVVAGFGIIERGQIEAGVYLLFDGLLYSVGMSMGYAIFEPWWDTITVIVGALVLINGLILQMVFFGQVDEYFRLFLPRPLFILGFGLLFLFRRYKHTIQVIKSVQPERLFYEGVWREFLRDRVNREGVMRLASLTKKIQASISGLKTPRQLKRAGVPAALSSSLFSKFTKPGSKRLSYSTRPKSPRVAPAPQHQHNSRSADPVIQTHTHTDDKDNEDKGKAQTSADNQEGMGASALVTSDPRTRRRLLTSTHNSSMQSFKLKRMDSTRSSPHLLALALGPGDGKDDESHITWNRRSAQQFGTLPIGKLDGKPFVTDESAPVCIYT
jgi:hypothetical protein